MEWFQHKHEALLPDTRGFPGNLFTNICHEFHATRWNAPKKKSTMLMKGNERMLTLQGYSEDSPAAPYHRHYIYLVTASIAGGALLFSVFGSKIQLQGRIESEWSRVSKQDMDKKLT
eukprot:799754-Pelagomonas_calceolata.AAC.1